MTRFPGRAVPLAAWRNFACLLALGLLVSIGPAGAGNPSALWQIVHGKCVPDEEATHDPAPCRAVELTHGFAVLKDIRGLYQYLLIPTQRVSGIDDPAILDPHAPNYWQSAWDARNYLEQLVGRPLARDVLSLAINSAFGRTQDQLHIHIDCISPSVFAALQRYEAGLGPDWTPFPVPLAGHQYRAMWLDQPELGTLNPFQLLAKSIPDGQMRWHTLVLVGATIDGRPGFVLLDGRAAPGKGDFGAGEELQDHDCAILENKQSQSPNG